MTGGPESGPDDEGASRAPEPPDGDAPAEGAPAVPAPEPSARQRRPRRPVFSLQGRAAPGLYVAGWVLTLLGIVVFGAILASTERETALVDTILEGSLLALGVGLLSGAAAQALQRRADAAAFTGPSPFLAFAAVFFVVSAIVYPITLLLHYGLHVTLGPGPDTLLNLVITVAVYVGAIQLLVVDGGALGWREIVRPLHLPRDRSPAPEPTLVYGAIDRGREPRRDLVGDISFAVALLVPVLVATIVLTAALVAVLRIDESQVPPTVPLGGSSWDRALVAIAAVILAPIGEELFFRGYATNAWARTSSKLRAIVVGGLFFAFVHVLTLPANQGQPYLALAAIAFGARVPVAFALGWLYLTRRSVYASASLHALYNGTLLLIAYSALK